MLRGAAVPRTQDDSDQGQEIVESSVDDANCRGHETSHDEPGITLTLDPSEEVPSPLQTPRVVLSTFDDESTSNANQHRRHQTEPNASSLYCSAQAQRPIFRGHFRHLSDMPLTGDGKSGRRGSSSSLNSLAASIRSKRGNASLDPTPRSVSASQTPFGLISSFTHYLTGQSSSPQYNDDQLLDLDIQAAIYPSGAPTESDTFSPAAFKNLHVNATGLLMQLQDAYRRRTMEWHQMKAEREADQEEAQEREIRLEHTKMQLAQLATTVAEKDRELQNLMVELKAEKRARHAERITREKLLGEGSMVTEDLGVDEEERKKWRKSGSTEKSDESFDTDEESIESESVFSRGEAPTILTNATESVIDVPLSTSHHDKLPTLEALPKHRSAKEMSTFQTLMKRLSGEGIREDGSSRACKNCQGQDASVAWNTVSLLRDENKGLKQRVAQLETAVEGALDLVNGIGMEFHRA